MLNYYIYMSYGSEFKRLLDNPNNNILVDIHSCPIERAL